MRQSKKKPTSMGVKLITGLTDLRDAIKRGDRLEDRFVVRQIKVPKRKPK